MAFLPHLFFLILLVLPPLGDHLSSRCSPRPLRASLVSSSSTSSFRRALSSTRATLSISPVVPTAEQVQSHNGQRSNAPGSPQNQQLERDFHLDPDSISVAQDPQEDDPLDMQEVSKLFLSFLRKTQLENIGHCKFQLAPSASESLKRNTPVFRVQ